MPKVKELGVTVVPEGFGPVGIGGGGGCGITNPCLLCTRSVTVCGYFTRWACTDCTSQPFSICGTSPGPAQCTDCTTQAFSICGTTPGPVQTEAIAPKTGWCCTDCTTQAFSICGTTPGPAQQARVGGGCTDCTTQAFSICGTTPGPRPQYCTDCTTKPFSICGTTPGPCTDCTTQAFSICGTSPGQCSDCTTTPFSICGTTPNRPQQVLTQESINQLRSHLQQQLSALDEAEKQIGPKTEEEIAAREQELQQELDKLRSRRNELKSKE